MTSLAFILNPLERSNGGSSASTERPLPTLAAAIAQMPTMPGWAGVPSAFFHSALAPLSTIAAHHQLTSVHFAATSESTAVHKKQRFQYIAAKHSSAISSSQSGGARSPTTSSEDDLSSCDDAEADHEDEHECVTGQSAAKKTRLCKERGCTSLAVSRRSCVRHGGGSRCTFEGCSNGAKLRNRCFQHGGSTICLADSCTSKAKRYGYCWSHGGGRICSTEGCVKVAAQGGSCWAHGGGNRCKLGGCSKRSYQKHGYFCKAHAAHNI
ncbi:hypothetical protein Gpo141_00012618 [Globisporangium polare]